MRRWIMVAAVLVLTVAVASGGYAQTPAGSGDKMEKMDKKDDKKMDKKGDAMMDTKDGKMMDTKDGKMSEKKDDKMMEKK